MRSLGILRSAEKHSQSERKQKGLSEKAMVKEHFGIKSCRQIMGGLCFS